MSGTTGGHDVGLWLARHEIVTVRCAICGWSVEGPAMLTSRRGRERGVLARQRRHAARHVRNRESAARHYAEKHVGRKHREAA